MIEKKKPDTPLTDSFMASAPPGAKPLVVKLTWRDWFCVGIGVSLDPDCGVRVQHFKPALKRDGKRWHWGVEIFRRTSADGKECVELIEQRLFTTEKAAEAELERCMGKVRAQRVEMKKSRPKPQASKTRNEVYRDGACEQVMREQYPDTCNALDEMADVKPEARAWAIEKLLRAYVIDFYRLHKPSKTLKGLPVPDTDFLKELGKAHEAANPFDPTDTELAAHWISAGYDWMTGKELAEVVNAITGEDLSTSAMSQRRLAKLGLETSRDPGPKPKIT